MQSRPEVCKNLLKVLSVDRNGLSAELTNAVIQARGHARSFLHRGQRVHTAFKGGL